MAAKTTKKKSAAKKAPEKKRIRPVVEVVEEEPTEAAPVEESAPQEETQEVVEEVVEEVEPTVADVAKPPVKKTGGVSLEPDFSSSVSEPVEESAPQEETQEVVEEVVEESTPQEEAQETVTEEVVEEASESPAQDQETITESVDEAPVALRKESSEHKMSIKSIVLIALISALVAAFVSGGVYVYLNGVNSLQTTSNTSEESVDTIEGMEHDTEATPEPTATPAENVDVGEFKLRVLNGSGEIGAAGKASDVLEQGGFVIEDTGNAATYDFQETIVEFKEDVPDSVVEKVVDALETTYKVKKSSSNLDKDSDYDIIVTVGTD